MNEPPEDYEPGAESLSIIDLLDRLESLVNQSRRLPLTPNIVVNEDELLDIVDQVRVALPSEIKEARLLLETRETRLREAQEQAQQLIAEAQDRADRLADEHEISRRAAAEAEQMLSDARDRSRKMRRDADEYARERMEELESQLTDSLAQVRRGLDALEAGRENAGDASAKPKGRGRRR